MFPRYEFVTKLAVLIILLVPVIGSLITARAYKKQLPPDTQVSSFYPTITGIIFSYITVAVAFVIMLIGFIGI